MKNPNFLELRPLPISNTQIMYHARQDLLLRLRFFDNHLKVLVKSFAKQFNNHIISFMLYSF